MGVSLYKQDMLIENKGNKLYKPNESNLFLNEIVTIIFTTSTSSCIENHKHFHEFKLSFMAWRMFERINMSVYIYPDCVSVLCRKSNPEFNLTLRKAQPYFSI